VNQNSFRNLQFNLSGLNFWLTLLAIAWILGSLGLGWLVKSFVIILGLVIIIPVVVILGGIWWINKNAVTAACPVCGTKTAGINGTEIRCPSCTEPLKVESGRFLRITPPGTVDIEAIDVSVKQIED
jgi:Zinc-ribbon containing domain